MCGESVCVLRGTVVGQDEVTLAWSWLSFHVSSVRVHSSGDTHHSCLCARKNTLVNREEQMCQAFAILWALVLLATKVFSLFFFSLSLSFQFYWHGYSVMELLSNFYQSISFIVHFSLVICREVTFFFFSPFICIFIGLTFYFTFFFY